MSSTLFITDEAVTRRDMTKNITMIIKTNVIITVIVIVFVVV